MRRLTLLITALLLALAAHAADVAFLGVVPDKTVPVKAAGVDGKGLLLKQVVSKGPAAEGGLRAGDILLTFNGKPIEDGDDLTFFLRKARPGDRVALEWLRNETRQNGAVRLGKRPASEAKVKVLGVDVGASLDDTAFLGIGTLAINDNLLQYFGVREGHGILVDAIVKGSPAERAGLRVGDVVVELGGHPVDSPGRLRRLMEDYRPGAKVRVKLVRDRQTLQVDVVFADRDGADAGDGQDEDLRWMLGYPGLPDLPVFQEDRLRRVATSFPGRAALDSTLNLMKRLVGTPLAMLEN